jgi:signal transduction histidine kinase
VTEGTPSVPAFPPARKTHPPDEVRRVLRLLIGFTLVLMTVGSAAFLIHLRSMALDAAAANTQAVARLMDEHLSRTLATTETLLARGAQNTQNRLSGRISTAQELQELLALEASLPERGSFVIADDQGHVTMTTVPNPLPTSRTVADREWFQAIAQGKPMTIGPMVFGRNSGKLLFTVNRRIEDEDGHFAGMISSGIETAFFTDFYNTLVLGRGGYIAADTGHQVMLRQPNPEKYVGISVKGGKVVAAAAKTPSGTLTTTSPLDGIERIVSYRTLPRYGVVISVGMAIDDVLAPWRHTALLLGLALAAVSLALVGLSALAFRGLAREESITAGLEATIAERTLESERRAEEARQANDSKTRFLAAASHDLRQPLQAAGMFTEVLAGQVEDPRQVKVLDKLRQSLDATNSLLTTLLDVSGLEAGKIKPNVTSFRLMPLLTGLVEQMEPEASAKGLVIGAAPTSAVITSDPVLLERLLRNLLVNAVRYTAQGGILVGCRRRGPDHLVIQVFDTGIGIEADKLSTVFEDFVRLDTPALRATGQGLGLGLGVVRRMAALLGHPLELASRPGRGSCFGVVVPRA